MGLALIGGLTAFVVGNLMQGQSNAKITTALAALFGGVATVLAAAAPSIALSTIAIGLISFSATLSSINSQSLVYIFADSTYRARTLTWWSTFSLGASAGGGVLLSLLGEFMDLSHVLAVTGSLALIVGAALFTTRPAGESR